MRVECFSLKRASRIGEKQNKTKNPTLTQKWCQKVVPKEAKGTGPRKSAPFGFQITVTLHLLGGAAFTERDSIGNLIKITEYYYVKKYQH
jgi:hypothetical protein